MPLEGDRPLRLYYPDDDHPSGWRSYVAYARRQDRGGRVDGGDDMRHGEWTTAFVIRTPILATLRPMPDWRVRDEFGEQYTVEAVIEVPGSRGGRLRLQAFRSADAERLPE